jgi:hypothetical protein
MYYEMLLERCRRHLNTPIPQDSKELEEFKEKTGKLLKEVEGALPNINAELDWLRYYLEAYKTHSVSDEPQ